MSSGTIYPSEVVGSVASLVTETLTPAQVIAQFGASAKTPTRAFVFTYRGQHIAFTKGVPVVCDDTLIAALTAAGAPTVTGFPARVIEPWQPNDTFGWGRSFWGVNTAANPGQWANGNQRCQALFARRRKRRKALNVRGRRQAVASQLPEKLHVRLGF